MDKEAEQGPIGASQAHIAVSTQKRSPWKCTAAWKATSVNRIRLYQNNLQSFAVNKGAQQKSNNSWANHPI